VSTPRASWPRRAFWWPGCFIKLVEDSGRGIPAGATPAGPCGGEVLGMLALAVPARVPTRRLREMIYACPTFHRAVEDALRAL